MKFGDFLGFYIGVRLRTCELFLCFASFVFLGSVELTSLFSYFLRHAHKVKTVSCNKEEPVFVVPLVSYG